MIKMKQKRNSVKLIFGKKTIPHNREESYLQMPLTARRAGLTLLSILGVTAWRKAQAIGAPCDCTRTESREGSGYLKRLSAPANDLNRPMISLLLLLLRPGLTLSGHAAYRGVPRLTTSVDSIG